MINPRSTMMLLLRPSMASRRATPIKMQMKKTRRIQGYKLLRQAGMKQA
jgi:hypothetical protein